MALTLEEFKQHQDNAVQLQRLALWYAERGEDRVSKDVQGAAFRASKLRPAKETPAAEQPASAAPAAVKTAKEKAA